ncbi:hypothetical protein XaFJ1_GM002054 [Xanthomonas albilineans]|nr:hypothetical protein XaFJ1_GM002054 [Xanthomonas albilineans]
MLIPRTRHGMARNAPQPRRLRKENAAQAPRFPLQAVT